MEILGLNWIIWAILAVYFAAMLAVGWWSKRGSSSQEGYLLGGRRFGTSMMVMHAFGAGTNPTDTGGCISKSMSVGAAGIWVSWLWMFGTPFYWIIAPIMRRMRCLTMTDYFEERFGYPAAVLYTIVAGLGMMIFFGGVLLITTRTVQGMMGKTNEELWFFGILFVTTFVFVLYGYWGGIIAAIRTDMVQGIMIIVLSCLAIWPALNLPKVGSLTKMRENLASASVSVNEAIAKARQQHAAGDVAGMLATLEGAKGYQPAGPIRRILTLWEKDPGNPEKREARLRQTSSVLEGAKKSDYLSLFNPAEFSLAAVIVLCLSAPLTALALPHLMSVTSAGKTEWEGRMGFAGGNILKRVCTIGWSILALCWLAHLIGQGQATTPDAAFGDAIRKLLPVVLQGLMLACVMAASMSSGDAVQVTVAGLFTQSIYRRYINPQAGETQLVRSTRITGLIVISVALLFAILMRSDLVASIILYFNVLAAIGISTAMGILWRRMNQTGVFCGTIAAMAVLIACRAIPGVPKALMFGAFMAAGFAFGVIGSLLSKPPDRQSVERFFTKIHVPIGQEAKLDLPLDEAVSPNRRLLTAGGLFIVKPSMQSWVGFLVVLGICIACVAVMRAIL
ncbi:MAG: sodium:solute symporter family protein [Phycisphaerae bacterium]|jgi:Na+/proline symporter|nr:sodium:solute symporter family protein [Phycisphaerae bacterium]